MIHLMTVCFPKDFTRVSSTAIRAVVFIKMCLLERFECQWHEFNLWLHMWFILRVEGLLSSFLHSPSTISWEIASVTPCWFFSFILISPVSFLWHLLRSSRLWLPHFSTFTLLSPSSSSPSLYHWILMGSWPTKGILNMAFCPALTFTGSVKTQTSLGLNLGGSKQRGRQDFHKLKCLNSLRERPLTFDIDHCLCLPTVGHEAVFPRMLLFALCYD